MFKMLDDEVPIEVYRSKIPDSTIADHFGLRVRKWGDVSYGMTRGNSLPRLSRALADRLAGRDDLRFIKLGVIWTSEESPDRLAAFRDRIGLDASAILWRTVVADGASPEDWAALFLFALEFGWNAATLSRHANALVLFSHDEYLRASPASLVRGL